MKQQSLRGHLLVWQLAWLLVLFLASCPVVIWLANKFADQVYDENLLKSADSVIARIENDKDGIKVDLPATARKWLRHQDKDSFYYQVLGPENQLIDCDEYLPVPKVRAKPGDHVFYNDLVNGDRVRALEVCLPHPQHDLKSVYIQVAETVNTRQAFTHIILLALFVTQGLFISVSALAIWLGVNRGLMPLKNLEGTLARRSPTDLEPVPIEDAPTEAVSLVRIINALLAEVSVHIDRQARFAGNVAHQLRTPLSGIKTYVGLALRATSDEKVKGLLEQIDTGILRLISLIEKMLLLARSDPTLLSHKIDSRVDLNTVVLEATAELMPHSAKKHIELEVSPLSAPVEVFGDPLSLLELTKNITENAIAHSPEGGNVRVKVNDEHGISLIVEDNGPGIPKDERERVFEPFYRTSSTTVAGTGLGLSIALDIAKAHRATISIQDGEQETGTRVVVTFPPTKPL